MLPSSQVRSSLTDDEVKSGYFLSTPQASPVLLSRPVLLHHRSSHFLSDIFLHRKPYSRCQVKHYHSLKPLSPCQQKRTWRKKHKFWGLYQTMTVCITPAKSAICHRRSRLTSCRLSCRLIASTCEDFSCVCCWHWWPLCKVWRQRNDRITRLLSAYKGKWRDTHTPA